MFAVQLAHLHGGAHVIATVSIGDMEFVKTTWRR